MIHALVRSVVEEQASGAKVLIDVGCGTGTLARALAGCVESYVGCDVVRYPGFPDGASFVKADLNHAPYPVAEASADVVACVETIEHLENPRMVMRELVRIVRPGGLVLVTTPNQLSFLSKLTLVVKNQFQAFQDPCYPAHITALVEQRPSSHRDGVRAREAGDPLHGFGANSGDGAPLALARGPQRAVVQR